jgi:hypothetical protein
LPDIENRFWTKYQSQGLKLIAIDPGGKGGLSGMASTDSILGVQAFANNLQVTYPVGLEDTMNYQGYAANYPGPNPFPVDILVGKDGKIAYIAREYDPMTMESVLQTLLAQ